MPTISQTPTAEKSTRIIIPIPTDEAGTALTIGQLTTPVWSLTTRGGLPINSRTNVVLSALYIVLTGDDLAMIQNDPWRVVTIEARYNSATYGNGLYLKDQYEFPVGDLLKVT